MRFFFMSVLLAPSIAWGVEDSPSPTQIQTWIDQLESDRFEVRERATRRLVDAGPDVIEPLLVGLKSAGLETTTRALTILRDVALQDHAWAVRAENIIQQLAENKASSLSKRASEVLKALAGLRTQRGVKILSALGANFSNAPGYHDEGISADVFITLGRHWKGTPDDLNYVLWLTEYNRMHFTLRGNKVDDEFVKKITECPFIVSLQINRANVTDESIKYIRKLKHLQLVSLRYSPFSDKSIPDLRLAAEDTALQVISVFGTGLTKAAIESLQQTKERLIVRYRSGGFLGVSGNEASDPTGCYISFVQPNHAAAKAGLKRGDIILKYQGHVVKEFSRPASDERPDMPPTLSELIGLDPAGAEVEVTILRDDQQLTKRIVLGEWP